MIIPLKHRYLFYHDASDAYLPVHLSPGAEYDAHYKEWNDGNLDDVTGIERHERQYYFDHPGAGIAYSKAKPLRCRYLAWFDHKDDQYYQEMYLTHEQQRALFGAFDDVHCPDDVTGEIEHEARFTLIKKAIKEKIK